MLQTEKQICFSQIFAFVSYQITYFDFGQSPLSNFMELSPFWEANNCSSTQEIPSILWNLKAHYHVPDSPPLDLIST
jgi:hypothetical protein